jgi:hypothetical protein
MEEENIQMKATRAEETEEVENARPPSVPEAQLSKVETYLEDDPHRAALEDNPEKPEPLTLMEVLAIAVSFSPFTFLYWTWFVKRGN